MASRRLLQTGASGYVGGLVFTCLLTSDKPENMELKISVIVRKQEQAEVLHSKGLHPILFEGLDDGEGLTQAASEHDTSGTSNLAIRGITQQAEESRLFSDRDNDVYEYEKERNATERYERRDTDLKVIQLGEELGIKTIIVMAPVSLA
ncbi:putative NAD-dependent epimerase/dehydratase domain-containing protein [Seiridium cardinale]